MGFPCPCCEFLTLSEEPPETYEICTVCGWEDDGTDVFSQEPIRGANSVNIVEARINFKCYGAIDKDALEYVRKPYEQEIPLGKTS